MDTEDEVDFHFFRLDQGLRSTDNGSVVSYNPRWTHKPGTNAITDLGYVAAFETMRSTYQKKQKKVNEVSDVLNCARFFFVCACACASACACSRASACACACAVFMLCLYVFVCVCFYADTATRVSWILKPGRLVENVVHSFTTAPLWATTVNSLSPPGMLVNNSPCLPNHMSHEPLGWCSSWVRCCESNWCQWVNRQSS